MPHHKIEITGRTIEQQQLLNVNHESEDDIQMSEQDQNKRFKSSGDTNPLTMLSQHMITPDQRASKITRLEAENLLLKERIANMEKLIEHNYRAAATNEEHVIRNNRFGLIMQDESIDIDSYKETQTTEEENNPFETVKKAIKRKNANTTINMNKKVVTNAPTKLNNKPANIKTNKLPPLHIHNQNIKDTIQLVKGAKIENFEIRRVNNNKHSLITTNFDDYDQMQNILKEVNTNYFTFTPKELKPKTVVLKGLNEDEEINEIKTYIESHNIKVTNVSQLKTKRSLETKVKLPLFIVQCTAETDMRQLYKINTINHQKITWENLRKKDRIIQCRKCQRLGHVAVNCNLEYRCVKCSLQHKPGECQIKNTIEIANIYCVNCKSNGHPASFKGCPTYQNAILRLKQKIKDKHDHATLPKLVGPTQINPSHGSYADVLKQSNTEQLTIHKLANRVEKMAMVIQQQSEQISQLLSMLNKL